MKDSAESPVVTSSIKSYLLAMHQAAELLRGFNVSDERRAVSVHRTLEWMASVFVCLCAFSLMMPPEMTTLVLSGSTDCGAMAGLLDQSQLAKLPAVRSWLGHAESTHRIIEENYAHITDAAPRLAVTVEENALVQLEHLRTHPAVAAAIARQSLNLQGWVYKFETGQVFGYHPQEGQFVSVEGTSFAAPSTTRELSPI